MKTTSKIPIKIVISGNRACGKSVMAQYLADMFSNLGAEVVHIDSDTLNKFTGAANTEYYRRTKKKFYKQKITIQVKDVKATASYDKQYKLARKYLQIWSNE